MKLVSLLFLLAGLFVPAQAQAQAPTAVPEFCLNTTSDSLFWMPATGPCPASFKDEVPTRDGVTTATTQVCLVKQSATSTYFVSKATATNAAGTEFKCTSYTDTAKYSLNKQIATSSISGTPPVTTTTPTPTPSPTPKPTPKPTPTTTTPTTTTQGSCPSGTHKEGPLCVPDNPFANSSGIAGQGTIGELATTIISILLYISGIIAVIMIIIGGYTWMTARGNETQVVNGRKTTINALIGLAIVVLAYVIVQGVINFIIKGT